MKKRDIIILGCAALLALALILLYRSGSLGAGRALQSQTADGSVSVSLYPLVDDGAAAPKDIPLMQKGAARLEADSYLRVTVGRSVYEPVPLSGDWRVKVSQQNGRENIVLIRGGVVSMESANCPNHDCIRQGSVSLDNRDLRAMQSAIICLPNQVVLELMDEKEASAYYGEGT